MNPSNKIKLSVLLTIAAFPALSYAEDVQTGELPEVTVSGKRPAQSGSRLDSGSKDSLDILDGQKLKSARSTSLGQTVERISGVQNSSFGPGNGTPQIRSLGGTRVKLMENGLGISDTAAFGGNLPTAVHPFMADKITVHKSSTAVLYGGNAIGGAVNVETGQIPDELPEKNLTGKAEISGGYNTPHTELLSVNGKTGRITWHIDGINSKISHYRIPGNSKADACFTSVGERHYFPYGSACQFEVRYNHIFNKGYYRYVMQNYLDRGEAWRDIMGLDYADIYRTDRPGWGNWAENPLYDPSITSGRSQTVKSITHITPNEHGKLTNSHQHTRNFSAGASYIGSQGYAGIGVSRYLTNYGMPGYSFLNTRSRLNGALPTNISADQTRWTAEAQYRPDTAWLDNIKTQLAYTDAENRELLADHFVSSIDSRNTQLRVELNHKIGSLIRG
ncbi:TonB-dependent receptor plug domain-containing protein, partial [Neisseria elongata]